MACSFKDLVTRVQEEIRTSESYDFSWSTFVSANDLQNYFGYLEEDNKELFSQFLEALIEHDGDGLKEFLYVSQLF